MCFYWTSCVLECIVKEPLVPVLAKEPWFYGPRVYKILKTKIYAGSVKRVCN